MDTVSQMEMLLLVAAALCFSFGGLAMKFADGVARPGPAAAFLGLFVAGAVLQSLALRKADLGVAYIAVLGLEAVLTFAFSVWLLHEAATPTRIAAVLLILGGVVLLRK